MIGFKLTAEQALQLIGKEYTDGCLFNPVPDINGDKFIFEGERDGCTNKQCMWVKDLPPSEYVPPIKTELQ